MISRFVRLNPASGCALTAWSLFGILCFPLSAPTLHSLSLSLSPSKINNQSLKKRRSLGSEEDSSDITTYMCRCPPRAPMEGHPELGRGRGCLFVGMLGRGPLRWTEGVLPPTPSKCCPPSLPDGALRPCAHSLCQSLNHGQQQEVGHDGLVLR